MRGIFSAGVLDVLLDEGLVDFDVALGTSAGACNLASFVCRQPGRNYRCYIDIMCRPELFSARRFLRGGHFIELDWLWERFIEEEPLDLGAFARSATQFVSVATCARDGVPHYTTCTPEVVWEPVKGSCAMPLLYRGPVRFLGDELVDGGVSAPIAAPHAYALGARRIVVVRSRPRAATPSHPWFDVVASLALREKAALARAIRRAADCYAECEKFVARPPADARIVELAPPRALCSRTTTQQRALLHADYELGKQVARSSIAAVADLLA